MIPSSNYNYGLKNIAVYQITVTPLAWGAGIYSFIDIACTFTAVKNCIAAYDCRLICTGICCKFCVDWFGYTFAGY